MKSFALLALLFLTGISFSYAEEPAVSVDSPKNQDVSFAKVEEEYNFALEAQNSGKSEIAAKYYASVINSSINNPELRSKAFQNLGVIEHLAGREIMMQNPEESLKFFDKAEKSYKESLKLFFRKDTANNQQLLLNDRKKAQEIIKNRKDMQDKLKQAQEKTKEALDKQQQANQAQDKQDKEQKQKDGQ